MSVTTSITYGFRTTTFDDPRQAELFAVLEVFVELAQSGAAALLDVFPALRWLPDSLLSEQKRAREQHKQELKLFMSLWLKVKQAIKDGSANSCFCLEMAKVQEKEGFSEELAAYNAGSMLEAGSDVRVSKRFMLPGLEQLC